MKKLKNATLLYLIKKDQHRITDICLAMKKHGFGINKWNGVGGKVEQNETIAQAAVREAKEEIGINAKDIIKVAKLWFYFTSNPDWDQLVHVYFCEAWDAEPVETYEMKPKWFTINDLPFNSMWPDDKFWLSKVINGDLLKAEFKYGIRDDILDKTINIVDQL